MWPPEGSVSPEAVAAYARAGVRWLATDEGNLWRSLALIGRGAPRAAISTARGATRGVDLVFRDREISDQHRLRLRARRRAGAASPISRRARATPRGAATAPRRDEPPLVPIFLDGENPWESYPGFGEPFLRALFGALSSRSRAAARASIGEHLDAAPARVELPRLHSGSWIDSDFHIWIGDPIKNRAWELLGRARAALRSRRRRGR